MRKDMYAWVRVYRHAYRHVDHKLTMLEQPIVYRHAYGHADMCIGMYAGMRIDIYTNMSMDMCMDMYIYIHAYGRVYRHV